MMCIGADFMLFNGMCILSESEYCLSLILENFQLLILEYYLFLFFPSGTPSECVCTRARTCMHSRSHVFSHIDPGKTL